MTQVAKAISWSSLFGLTLLPPILFATGAIDDRFLKWLMLAGTLIWFTTTPIWLKRDNA